MRWFKKGEPPRLLAVTPEATASSAHISRLESSPGRLGRRKSSESSIETNFYNLSDQVITVDKSPRGLPPKGCTPPTRRISLQSYRSPPQDNYINCQRNRGSCIEKDSMIYRDRKNPLLDKVKNTKLSCFKSKGPIHSGDDAASTSSSECSGHLNDTVLFQCSNDYAEPIESNNYNPWVRMPQYDDNVFLTKKTDSPVENKYRYEKYFTTRGSRCYSSGSEFDRYFGLSKNSSAKLSKSSDQIFNDDYDETFEKVPNKSFLFKSPKKSDKIKDDKDLGPNSCLSAKIRAMSDKYLKSSTNKFLSKLYKQNNETEDSHINLENIYDSNGNSSAIIRNRKKRGGIKAKLRSFSYGALPGLEEVHGVPTSVFHDNAYQIVGDDENALLHEGEDADSGILVNESAASSIFESDRISSRCDSSASHVNILKSCHGRSVSGDQTYSKTRASGRLSRDRYNSSQNRMKQSQRALSLDRKEILRRMPKSDDLLEPQYLQLTEKQKMRQRDGFYGDNGMPPIPPCRKPVKTYSTTNPVFEFKVVKILKKSPEEDLGIYIAKTKLSDDGHIGYLVAHVVPGGLAEREGSIKIGDELLNVNGKKIRDLSMTEAKEALRSGTSEIDIVISRPFSNDEVDAVLAARPPLQRPPTVMRESSVDYENSVLQSRQKRIDKNEVVISPRRLSQDESGFNRGSLSAADETGITSNAGAFSNRAHFCKSHNANYSSMNNKLLRRQIVSYSGSNNEPLSLTCASEVVNVDIPETIIKDSEVKREIIAKPPPRTNFCTLPRKPRASTHSYHTITFEKGPGKRPLGFTIVGGRDSPRGPLGIFIKSILSQGQAIDAGLLKAGDEVLAVNGKACHELAHVEALALFKAVRNGTIELSVCRRAKIQATKAKSCTDLLDDDE